MRDLKNSVGDSLACASLEVSRILQKVQIFDRGSLQLISRPIQFTNSHAHGSVNFIAIRMGKVLCIPVSRRVSLRRLSKISIKLIRCREWIFSCTASSVDFLVPLAAPLNNK